MSVASRFFPRAPRYTLRANDDNQMRFALMQTRGNALDTELINISQSGLKFTVFNGEVPPRGLDEGDMIKIEFRVPSGGRPRGTPKQIACFATVTRVEPLGNSLIEIAVSFRHLPSAFARALQNALPKKEDTEPLVVAETFAGLSSFPAEMNRQALILFSLSSLALFSLFLFMSTSPTQWLSWFSR